MSSAAVVIGALGLNILGMYLFTLLWSTALSPPKHV